MDKKVLVVSNMYPSKAFPSYGVFVRNFCDQLQEIHIATRLSVLTKTKNKGVKILKYGWFYLSTFMKCIFGDQDLVYIHYPSFSGKPVTAARKLKKFDIITNVHGTDVVPLKPEHERMLGNTEKAIALSKTVVVPSEYFKNLVIEKYGIPAEKVFVYPSGGVNENVFHEYDEERKAALKTEYGVKDRAFVIGYVSRINKAKGWDVFLDALEKLNLQENEEIKVFMVGSGEDDNALADRIDKLPASLKNAIVRYPLLDQEKLAEIYNLLDVFVFPTMSASESLGLVALEAMACGVPVLASDYAAPAYYVTDGLNGYKFTVGDVEELASRLAFFVHTTLEERKTLKAGALEVANRYKKKAILLSLQTVI